jgi:hypothetical protein
MTRLTADYPNVLPESPVLGTATRFPRPPVAARIAPVGVQIWIYVSMFHFRAWRRADHSSYYATAAAGRTINRRRVRLVSAPTRASSWRFWMAGET